jgi:hypothetical protein
MCQLKSFQSSTINIRQLSCFDNAAAANDNDDDDEKRVWFMVFGI